MSVVKDGPQLGTHSDLSTNSRAPDNKPYHLEPSVPVECHNGAYQVRYQNYSLSFPTPPDWYRTLSKINRLLDIYASAGNDALKVTRFYQQLKDAAVLDYGASTNKCACPSTKDIESGKVASIIKNLKDRDAVNLLLQIFELHECDNNKSTNGSLANSKCSEAFKFGLILGCLRKHQELLTLSKAG